MITFFFPYQAELETLVFGDVQNDANLGEMGETVFS